MNILVTDEENILQTPENTYLFLEDILSDYHDRKITWPKLVQKLDFLVDGLRTLK